jgi:hypothetical protein
VAVVAKLNEEVGACLLCESSGQSHFKPARLKCPLSPLQGEEFMGAFLSRDGAAKRHLPRAKLCHAFSVKTGNHFVSSGFQVSAQRIEVKLA